MTAMATSPHHRRCLARRIAGWCCSAWARRMPSTAWWSRPIALGIKAISLPLSEQLYAPLDLADSVVIVTSQSGESVEVHRLLEILGKRGQSLRS